MLACGENSADQNRRIDGRDFASPLPLAARDIDEVVVKAVFMRKFFPDEPQGLPDPFDNFVGIAVTAGMSDTETAEPESGCGNAGQRMCVAAVEEGTVLYLAAGARL